MSDIIVERSHEHDAAIELIEKYVEEIEQQNRLYRRDGLYGMIHHPQEVKNVIRLLKGGYILGGVGYIDMGGLLKKKGYKFIDKEV